MKSYPCPKCQGATALEDGRYVCQTPPCTGSLDKAMMDISEMLAEMAARSKPISAEDYAAFEWRERIAPSLAARGVSKEHMYRLAKWKCAPQQTVFEMTRDLCVGVGAIVALVGVRGCGKTTIASQIVIERQLKWSAWYSVNKDERSGFLPRDPGRIVKLHKLSTMFKSYFSEYGSIDTESTAELYEKWCRESLVVIDEIHEVEDMKASHRLLTDFLDRRYSGKRDTIIISNQSEADFRKTINPSILSRLGQYGRIIPCNWKSHRAAA